MAENQTLNGSSEIKQIDSLDQCPDDVIRLLLLSWPRTHEVLPAGALLLQHQLLSSLSQL